MGPLRGPYKLFLENNQGELKMMEHHMLVKGQGASNSQGGGKSAVSVMGGGVIYNQILS